LGERLLLQGFYGKLLNIIFSIAAVLILEISLFMEITHPVEKIRDIKIDMI